MRRALCALAATCLASTVVTASGTETHSKRIKEAANVLQDLRAAPGVSENLWKDASCIAVIPSVKKAAFIVGGEYGKGLMSCQKEGQWSAPAFVLLGKGSVGLQIGGEMIDLVLFVMNDRGRDKLLDNKVALGGEAAVAGGPVGRDARAMTDLQLKAEILSYSRAQGLFAGVDVTGGVLMPDKDDNRDLYGRKISSREILVNHAVPAPRATAPFMAALKETATSKRSTE